MARQYFPHLLIGELHGIGLGVSKDKIQTTTCSSSLAVILNELEWYAIISS